MKTQRDRITLSAARQHAASYESNLDLKQRKRLGQFFTGLPLSHLLAVLAVRTGCSTVIDPMVGHGDLLDAIFERCQKRGIQLQKVDAIEVDPTTARECQERLHPWLKEVHNVALNVYESNAFEPEIIRSLPEDGYDLVITNPPYVRYQTVADNGRSGNGTSSDRIRAALLQIVSDRAPQGEQVIWRELTRGYSGLSDLSVPAWLLAAALVKPGGTLGLVAPATWQNRDYADVLQYLLARCFKIEVVLADRQPGWFSKALVRTQLVVATRLPTELVVTPLHFRKQRDHNIIWVEVDPVAKKGRSLVGAAFDDEDPEGSFAEWLFHERNKPSLESKGIICVNRREENVVGTFANRRSGSWLKHLEPAAEDSPLFVTTTVSSVQWIPHELKHILPDNSDLNLHKLCDIGIQVSQGLRTGCNGFFYVEMIEKLDSQAARVQVSDLLGGGEIIIPMAALKPVLRRQSELEKFVQGQTTSGYVLDLREYILPEDLHQIKDTSEQYQTIGVVMPETLANLVRRAAQTRYNSDKDGKYIPELTAVKTNVRRNRSGLTPQSPRFWYMLPDFTRRHLPDAFVPRINQDTPWIIPNRKPPVLIDANFATIWAKSEPWTRKSIVGVLNSAWARTCMEAVGTPMGGGALKLEATHLRRLPMPKFSSREIERIDEVVSKAQSNVRLAVEELNKVNQIVVNAILHNHSNSNHTERLIGELHQMADLLRQARQRG